MNTARTLSLAATGALILAIAIGFWPVHANVALGTADCGSALRPKKAYDSYDVLADPTGIGLAATGAIDSSCDAARSGPAYAARGLGLGGIVMLIVLATSKRRSRAASS